MSDFADRKTIKRTIKPHRCEQCGQMIELGSKAEYLTGRYDGYFYSQHIHVECHEAALAYAELHRCWGEDFPWFQHHDHEPQDEQWMRETFPIVADRLGWGLPQSDDHEADHATASALENVPASLADATPNPHPTGEKEGRS